MRQISKNFNIFMIRYNKIKRSGTMKLLILGGTRFLGRALVEESLRRGHEVTLFNRGNNNHIFKDVEALTGDRNGDLSALKGRKWDAVIDTCGFVPHAVAKSAAVLADNIEHYTYISSISVYKNFVNPGIQEDDPVQSLPADQVEEITRGTAGPIYEYYGPLKALCEIEAEKHLPQRVLTVRAGLLVGPFDYTDRLPYWVKRIYEGGKVLCPGNPNRPVQLIDVKDLAAWIIQMVERKITGIYNATGPDYPLTIGHLLEICKQVTGSNAELVWVKEEFLAKHHVQPWIEMPLWIPESFPLPGEKEPWNGFFAIDISKAIEAGLTFRPLEYTIHDIFVWETSRTDGERKAGITLERETKLLEAWIEESLR
jgi:2'-hydroxyisoflavone reductase